MTKYNIHIGENKVPDEVIRKHQNFDKVMGDYKSIYRVHKATQPLYKNFKFLGLMVAVFTVTLVLLLDKPAPEAQKPESVEQNTNNESEAPTVVPADTVPYGEESDSTSTPQPAESETESEVMEETVSDYDESEPNLITLTNTMTPLVDDGQPERDILLPQQSEPIQKADLPVIQTADFIQPPLASLDIPTNEHLVDPQKGGLIKSSKTGSRIAIPPNCFVDKSGNIVREEVAIHYREIHTPVEMAMAGIPMALNHSQQLESAGMFQITGEVKSTGEEVFVASGKSITIEMPTTIHDRSFRTYYFDETKGTWQEEGNEKTSSRFMIKGSERLYPEAVPFFDILWEIAPGQQFTKELFFHDWRSYKITQQDKYTYRLQLFFEDNKSLNQDILINPVPLSYNGQIDYDVVDKKYQQHLEIAKNKDPKTIQELEDFYKTGSYQSYQEWLKTDGARQQMAMDQVVNIFNVNKFGFWNCDRPKGLPKGATLKPRFVNQEDKPIVTGQVFLVDYDQNTVFRYGPEQPIQFNPVAKNVLWTVTDDGKIAWYSANKLKRVRQRTGTFTFKMEVSEMNTIEALENALALNNDEDNYTYTRTVRIGPRGKGDF